MSSRAQALRAPSRTNRSEWQLVVAGLAALLTVLVTLVVLATVNAPSKGGGVSPAKDAGSQHPVVRVGGDGQYQYHPLP